MNKKKILIFGNQKASIDCADLILKEKDFDLSAFIACETENDKKDGNPSIKDYCTKKGIKYFNPERLDSKFLKVLEDLKPDYCLSILYRNIFKKNYLDLAKYGYLNMHPSLLPKYRGPTPRLWAVLSGEEYTGVTWHFIDEGIDTGDIVIQKKFKIKEGETGYNLNIRLNDLGTKLFTSVLQMLNKDNVLRKEQTNNNSSYYGSFNQSVRNVNWYDSRKLFLRRINMMTRPYSGCVAKLNNKKVIIWHAKNSNIAKKKLRGPGRVVAANDNSFTVSCVDGFVQIDEFDSETLIKKGDRFDI